MERVTFSLPQTLVPETPLTGSLPTDGLRSETYIDSGRNGAWINFVRNTRSPSPDRHAFCYGPFRSMISPLSVCM